MNLNQVAIPVSNIERAIHFYETLGLRLIVKALPDYAWFECIQGVSTFSLHRTNEQTPTGDVWIYFEVGDLDNYVNKLIGKGIVFEELPNDKSWLWRDQYLKTPITIN